MTPGRVKSLPVLISLLIPLLTAVLIAVFLAAVVDASNRRMPVATLVESPTVQEAQPSPEEIMAARPLAPTILDWQSQTFYPDAPLMVVPESAPSAAEVRSMLEAYLEQQFPDDQHAFDAAMALFDQVSVRQKVPNPSLRAALVGLKGTIGEPAIDTILNATIPDPNGGTPLPLVRSVAFVSDMPPGHIAEARIILSSGQVIIAFNNLYRAENPFLFTALMAHEAGHSDPLVGIPEEMILKLFEGLIYLQLLARHPELAQGGHELSRLLNTEAMALLNSGLGRYLGLFAGNGPVLPGSNRQESSFHDFWKESYSQLPNPPSDLDSPGNPFLEALMKDVLEAEGEEGEDWRFNADTLAAIDAALQAGRPFDAELLVAAAEAMGLDIGDAGPPPVGDYRVYVAVICR